MDTPLENKKPISKRLIIIFILGFFGMLLGTFLLKDAEIENAESGESVFSAFLKGSVFNINKPSEPVTIMEEPIDDELEAHMLDIDEIMEVILEDEDALMAELTDISGGESVGRAYILRDEGILYHYITAALPELEGVDYYEGWLINEETDSYFSTGKLQKGPDNTYELGYSEEAEMAGYNKVIISLEKTDDSTPETRILEGLAEPQSFD